MPRIQLAAWHGGRAPGTEIDVSDDDLRALARDGRVAAVLDPPTPTPDDAVTAPPDVERPPADAAPAVGDLPQAEEAPAGPVKAPAEAEASAPAATTRRKGR